MVKMTEFHRSWMIEVMTLEKGVRFVCYSPLGETFSDNALYSWQWAALKAAMQLVDQFYACYVLRDLLRVVYETEQISLEELQQLNASLDYLSRGQFTRSPS